jgi:hypothetical protein
MAMWQEFVERLIAELMPAAGLRPRPVRDASWWPL